MTHRPAHKNPQWTPWLAELLFSLQGPRPKPIHKVKVVVEGRKVPLTVYESVEAARERSERRRPKSQTTPAGRVAS
jgi:hypothetical protein